MYVDKLNNLLRYIGGLPKSIYVNLKLLPFKEAIKLPIIVSARTKLSSLEGNVILSQNKTGIIRIGFGNTQLVDYTYERSILHIEGTIHFHGKTKMGRGTRITVEKEGFLEIGKGFLISARSTIICCKKITIGSHSMFAWDSLIMDTDQHHIYNENNDIINEDQEIIIGEKVWLGTRCIILKSSTLPNGSIVAANTLICKKYQQEKTILAGNPVKVIKENVSW